MIRVLKQRQEGISFLELLLDETLCQGTIAIPAETVRLAGGINNVIKAKRKYELILRIAKVLPLYFEEVPEREFCEKGYVVLPEDSLECLQEYGWKTDCYVIGKYSGELRERGYFDAAVSSIVMEAEAQNRGTETLAFLEAMIGRGNLFYQIDDDTQPVLIYKGDDICHNVLTVFAEQLGSALERKGILVEYFDVSKEKVEDVIRYIDCHFKAIIGVQSYMFSIEMLDRVHYLHEYIYGPKYNFIFDHPVWVKRHMAHKSADFHILTHDMSYVEFTQKYFHYKARLFPPAGMAEPVENKMERKYNLTFVGTYGDYFAKILEIHQWERPKRFLANRFLLIMRQNPNMTLEDAFTKTLEQRGMRLDEETFLNELFELRITIYCVMHYYRAKVVRTLLDSGIQMDVFGDSWHDCPLRNHPNLICHSDITVEESLTVWQQSKLSLNVMSWHKAGFTERMAGIMMAGAVLVTDDTAYLHGKYSQEDMAIFYLDKLEELPKKIKALLENEEKRKRIAENGRRKTMLAHTWDRRAEQFLEMLQEDVKRA